MSGVAWVCARGSGRLSYFVIKVLVPAAIIALVSEIARRTNARRDDRIPAAHLDTGYDLALARYWRHRQHFGPCRGDLLVRAAVLADVPAGSSDAPQRIRLLDSHADGLCDHRRFLRDSGLGWPADRPSSLTAAIHHVLSFSTRSRWSKRGRSRSTSAPRKAVRRNATQKDSECVDRVVLEADFGRHLLSPLRLAVRRLCVK